MARRRMTGRWLFVALVSGPIVAAQLWTMFVAGGEQAGRQPFAAAPARNSAEAAAGADAATMLRFIRMGDDPTRIHVVRPEAISSRIVRVTTLEAALFARQVELIRVLDRERAIVGDEVRRELACLAADLDLPEAVAYLAADAACVRGEHMDRVIARSTPEAAAAR